jgi:hypothetical protein
MSAVIKKLLPLRTEEYCYTNSDFSDETNYTLAELIEMVQ